METRTVNTMNKPLGLPAIESEMARQASDARASFSANRDVAARIAASLRQGRGLVLLGMGASHSAGRALEPQYRAVGIDAVALPVSEQLGAPLSLDGKTVLISSQSGESAEVIRWLKGPRTGASVYGLTLDPGSSLARAVPSLVGAGGPETAFAATRSLTLSLALHLAVLAELGADAAPALAFVENAPDVPVDGAAAALAGVAAVVTSGRLLQGVAEAIALGFAELSRIPSFSLEGGQLRHGPMEMLGPHIGVVLFRARETASDLVAGMAASAAEAGSPVVVFDASGEAPVPGTTTIGLPAAEGPAAMFAVLPAAQRLMLAFAGSRVADVGIPQRSSKITARE